MWYSAVVNPWQDESLVGFWGILDLKPSLGQTISGLIHFRLCPSLRGAVVESEPALVHFVWYTWMLHCAKGCACIVLALLFRAELDLACQHVPSNVSCFQGGKYSYVTSKNNHLESLISTMCLFCNRSSLLLNLPWVIWTVWSLDSMEHLNTFLFVI